MRYRNLDIRIEGGARGGYPVSAASETHGEVDGVLGLDPDEVGLRQRLERLTGGQTDRAFLRDFGVRLYESLFTGDVERLFLRSYGAVERSDHDGLRLRLRIASPELAALPWELLHSPADKSFVGVRINSPIVRYLEMPTSNRSLMVRGPLRMLVGLPVGSDPALRVDGEAERAVIEQALRPLGERVEIVYVHERYANRRVTCQRIRQCLAEEMFHCFHFIGHGDFSGDAGALLLDADSDGDEWVPDERFAELFTNVPSMKLVVLNACKGATASATRRLTGTAARLAEQGVPAIVAMQFDILDRAAIDLAHNFYFSLLQSAELGRVDVAMSRARASLASEYRDGRELACPVLYLRADGDTLFTPEEGHPARHLLRPVRLRDTLESARDQAVLEPEIARLQRRIAVVKHSTRIGAVVAALVFCSSWIGLLDFFTLDTKMEFLVMGAGNALGPHPFSDELRIVTIDARELSTADTRRRMSDVIRMLAAAGAKVVALDAFYPAAGGEFAKDAASGRDLVATMSAARPSTRIVVGARELADGELEIPHAMAQVVDDDVGHLCVEEKLNLVRSLPITVGKEKARVPSLALVAYAAFRDGRPLRDASEAGAAIVNFPDAASKIFVVSETEVARRAQAGCPVIQAGDSIAHRFLRLTSLATLQAHALTDEQLASSTARDDAPFSGKLVLVGMLSESDVVTDLAGDRPGVLWQADALNGLLLDTVIRPLPRGMELLLMLALAGAGAALRQGFSSQRWRGLVSICVTSMALMAFVLYACAQHGLLVNPSYHLVALWLAWWSAGRLGRAWSS